MASEMQERIALALFDEAERQLKAAYPNRDPAQWGMAKEFDRVSHLAYARAVIAAMLEPSDSMVVAALRLSPSMSTDEVERIYRAMIDAAIMEEPDGLASE